MEKERYIAFFDILGFKELVNSADTEFLVSRMREFEDIIKLSSTIPGFKPNQEKRMLNFVQFSDSIVFYTEGLQDYEFSRLVFVSKMVLYFSLIRGLPLRGCISHGEFYIEGNLFFGKALIQAYEKGESQDWAGGFISEETIQYINNRYPKTIDFLTKKGFLIEHKVPFKNTNEDLKYAINWSNLDFDQEELQIKREGQVAAGFMLRDIHKAYIQEGRNGDIVLLDYSSYRDDVKKKINNTINFYNKAKDVNKASYIKFIIPE